MGYTDSTAVLGDLQRHLRKMAMWLAFAGLLVADAVPDRMRRHPGRAFRAGFVERDPIPAGSDPYPGFKLKSFGQKADHFNFEINSQHDTWNQRYMISTGTWDPAKKAPVMFFTGAEGGNITRLYSCVHLFRDHYFFFVAFANFFYYQLCNR